MFKICLMILSLLFLTDIPYANNNDFDEKINKSYEKYAEYYDYTNDNFSLKIIRGKVNGKYTYGICFSNAFAKTYNIELYSEGEKFILESDRRGDICVLALSEIKSEYVIYVYKDSEVVNLPVKAIIQPFDESDFVQSGASKISYGENKGATITKLSKEKNVNFDYLLPGICFISVGCLIIILIFAKTKKGMFSKEKRKEGTFNFKEFLSSEFNEEPKSEFDIIDINPLEETNDEAETEREIYQKSLRDDEFEESNFPLADYLRDKGFITDYKFASEDEKQKIMLELMKLKDDKKITEDEYLEEAYKLWKE